MASDNINVIDLEPLLARKSPEAPSGATDLRDDPAFGNLEIMIKGTPAVYMGKELKQEAQPPDWRKVQSAAVELLCRGHDLQVAVMLTRALLHTEGLQGLCTGLNLIHGLVEGYWETLYPQLDPDDDLDPTERSNILEQLSAAAEILEPLKRIALCDSRKNGRHSYRDILVAGGKIKPSAEENAPYAEMAQIEAAFEDTDAKMLAANRAVIRAAGKTLTHLTHILEEKIKAAGNRPDLNDLQELLTKMEAVIDFPTAKDVAEPQTEKGNESEDNRGGTADSSPLAGKQHVVTSGKINSRQEVIRQLDRICSYYERNEPASPIPLLLKRARQLVDKNFLEIIQDLAPDSAKKIKALVSGPD